MSHRPAGTIRDITMHRKPSIVALGTNRFGSVAELKCEPNLPHPSKVLPILRAFQGQRGAARATRARPFRVLVNLAVRFNLGSHADASVHRKPRCAVRFLASC